MSSIKNESLGASLKSQSLRGGGIYKLLLAGLCAIVLASTQVKAEESGVFVGAQVMYGDLVYTEDIPRQTGYTLPATAPKFTSTNTGPGYGVVGGYKHFFSPFFGFRAYGSFYYNQFTFQTPTVSFGQAPSPVLNLEGGKSSIYQFNLTANAEALFNIIAGENFNLGVFGGLGIGFQYWKSKRIDTMYDFHQILLSSYNVTQPKAEDRRFGIALNWNVGVRTNILKYHSIEVGAMIPMFNTTIFDYETYYALNAPNSLITHKVDARQSYNAFVRYTFGF
ncbi:outer membrane beta-barrel protein [Helicobacter sp. 23-1046]